MGKTKTDRKVNKRIREFNRELKEDVFKGRFWVRQYQKARVDGMSYYLYELIDNEQPSRNKVIFDWIRGESPFFFSTIWEGMNDFIIKSDFWEKWRKEREENEL